MTELINLTEMELDALKEAGNIGIGNAATALSKMLNKKIGINLLEIKLIPVEKFADEIGGVERIVVCLYLQVVGDLSGECMLFFSKESAMELIDLLMMKKNGETKIIEEMEKSAFMEMGNIFVGAYVTALAKMLSMKLYPSVPHMATDMLQALIDFMLIKLSLSTDKRLCVKTEIDIDNHKINGQFIMIFENESLIKMMNTMHSLYGI